MHLQQKTKKKIIILQNSTFINNTQNRASDIKTVNAGQSKKSKIGIHRFPVRRSAMKVSMGCKDLTVINEKVAALLALKL